MRRTHRALVIVALTLASCSTQVVPASTPTSNAVTLRVYATTAARPLLDDLTAAYLRARPAVAIETRASDYQVILGALLSHETPYFLSSHLPPESALWAAPLGQDGIAVVIHPDNSTPGLSIEQMRRIYQGHIANWQEVGGPNLEVIVISREEGSGTRAEFERQVMGERRTTRSAQIAPSSDAMVASVARQAGGIGYVSMSYLDSSIRALPVDGIPLTPDNVYDNIYPLRSTLYVVGLAEPEGHYLEFIGWIQSREGQAAVAERYAPLLRP